MELDDEKSVPPPPATSAAAAAAGSNKRSRRDDADAAAASAAAAAAASASGSADTSSKKARRQAEAGDRAADAASLAVFSASPASAVGVLYGVDGQVIESLGDNLDPWLPEYPPDDAPAPMNAAAPLPADLSAPNRKWLEHVRCYASNRGLRALHHALRAPYLFLDHASGEVEHRLIKIFRDSFPELFHHFNLVSRGSLISRTALRGTADLDLDIVFHSHQFAQQFSGGLVQNAAHPALWDWFHNMTEQLRQRIIDANQGFTDKLDDGVTSNAGLTTRSIKLLLTVNGTATSVDLFPKLLDEVGNVWGPLGVDEHSKVRPWRAVPFGIPAVNTQKWSEEHHLAVLLLKLWKVKCKEEAAAPPVEATACDFPKGYHLNLAMHHIVSTELTRTQASVYKSMSMQAVVGLLRRLVALLMRAYHPDDGCRPELFFQMGDAAGKVQPFQLDTQDVYDHKEYLTLSFPSNKTKSHPPLNPLQSVIIDRLRSLRGALDLWTSRDSVPRALTITQGADFHPRELMDEGFVSIATLLPGAKFHLTISAADVLHEDGSSTGYAQLQPLAPIVKQMDEYLKEVVEGQRNQTMWSDQYGDLVKSTLRREDKVGKWHEMNIPLMDEDIRAEFEHEHAETIELERQGIWLPTRAPKLWELSSDTIGVHVAPKSTRLVWLLPSADEFQVDRDNMRPMVILLDMLPIQHWRLRGKIWDTLEQAEAFDELVKGAVHAILQAALILRGHA